MRDYRPGLTRADVEDPGHRCVFVCVYVCFVAKVLALLLDYWIKDLRMEELTLCLWLPFPVCGTQLASSASEEGV